MKIKLPTWFWIGLVLNLSSWALSWLQIKPFSYYTFIGIWIGFILILDGINFKLKGSSMLTRDRSGFIFTFLLSSIFWWIFEILVMVTKNWYYITDINVTDTFSHQLLGTLFFSTVIPAVFEMAEIISNKNIVIKTTKDLPLKHWIITAYPFAGLMCLLLTVVFPRYFYYLMWIFLYFVLDYINHKLGFDSLIKDILKKQWRRVLSLALAGLFCGFFWEMWNYYADPKWFYSVPLVGVFKIFEMPAIGFSGYLPFGLEIFAFFTFLQGITRYPKEKLFLLSNWSFEYTKQPIKVFISVILILSVFMVGFGLVEDNLYKQFSSQSLFKEEILPARLEESFIKNSYSGSVESCTLGIIPGKCLFTAKREVFLLVDNSDNAINLTNQENVIVVGNIKSQEIGIEHLVTQTVYKLN